MTDQQQVLDTVGELAQVLLSEETVQTTLQRIVDLATGVIEHGDGVSVTVFENGRPTTAASSDAFAVDVDLAQYRAGDGPCLCALEPGKPILVFSTADDDRWPSYSRAAVSAGVHCSLSLPLVAGDASVGALNVYSRTVGALKDENDQTVASIFAEHAAVALANAQAFEAERSLAVALQRTLLPQRLPEVDGVAIAARYLPAGRRARVGGDWYDAFWLPRSDRLALVVGDVVGHDVQATAMMGQLRAGLRAYALEGHSPAAVLERLSDLLTAIQHTEDLLATVIFVLFDTATQAITYSNAGHPPPLVVGADGTVRLLSAGASPFVGADSPRADCTESLCAGDALLLYTDGLIEQRGRPLDEGLHLLMEAPALWSGGPAELCDLVVDRMLGDGGSDDDVAVLAFKPTPR